jgi:hypothetical protein
MHCNAWGPIGDVSSAKPVIAATDPNLYMQLKQQFVQDALPSGGTLNTWRSGDDGWAVAERSLVRF